MSAANLAGVPILRSNSRATASIVLPSSNTSRTRPGHELVRELPPRSPTHCYTCGYSAWTESFTISDFDPGRLLVAALTEPCPDAPGRATAVSESC